MKRVLLTRLGAFGDCIIIAPLIRLLAQDGWQVTVNTNKRGVAVLKHNPYVHDILFHDEKLVPPEKLEEHWKEISKGYDKYINLSGSIEGKLLKVKGDYNYDLPWYQRHSLCNVNYYDRTLELGGYGHVKGLNGELYFSPEEEQWGADKRSSNDGSFIILWSLSGSSVHKFYPWAETVALEFLNRHDDAMMYTVGDGLCSLLQWDHPRNKKKVLAWDIRKSFVMAKYADLVVGNETGILNASGCFPTPKIVFLSHSSHENLSKYWENCIPLEASRADAPCHPCHKMIYGRKECPLNGVTRTPVCMAHLRPEKVLEALESVYSKWRDLNGLLARARGQEIFCGG